MTDIINNENACTDAVGRILVAVYGTLKKNYSNHHLISDSRTAEYKGVDTTEGILTHLDKYPGAVRVKAGSIRIEVYSVDKECLDRLDHLEGHPRFFQRHPIDTVYGKAWMYFVPARTYFAGKVKIIEDGIWTGPWTFAREFKVSAYMSDGDTPRFLLKTGDPRPRIPGTWTVVPVDNEGVILLKDGTPAIKENVLALPAPKAANDDEPSIWPRVVSI